MGYNFSTVEVLIVDDSAHMRKLVKGLLQAYGIKRVREAENGDAALGQVDSAAPDIIITDYAMKPMDGLDFTRRIRSDPESRDPFVPIILMTGYTEQHRVVLARDAGVTEVVAKPVTVNSLYSRLVSVIEQPRPFIRTEIYFGPDRRRRQDEFDGEERRAEEPEGFAADAPADAGDLVWD